MVYPFPARALVSIFKNLITRVANMEYYEKTINNNPNKLYIFQKVIKYQINKKIEK